MRDESRLDLPSASSFECDVACAGRQNLLKRLSPEAFKLEVPDETATSGTKIHAARETGDTTDLESEELDTYQQGMENEQKLLQRWKNDFGIESVIELPREARYWINDSTTLKPLTSAQLDVHYISEDERRLLIVDWKSFFCFNLIPSDKSWQGRVQSVAAWKEYSGVEHVRFAFNKAMFARGAEDFTDYTINDLQNAERSILFRLWETTQADAQCRAGPHCNYCVGKPYCRDAASYSLLPSVIASTVDALARVDDLTPVDLVLLWQRSTIIEKVMDRVKKRLKGLPEEELTALGVKLDEGRKLDEISAVYEAFEKLKASGLNAVSIFDAMKFTKGELVKLLQASLQLSKAGAEKWIDTELDSFITRNRAEKSLRRIKE